MFAALSFLTNFPTKAAELEEVVREAWLFPLLGLLLGLLFGLGGLLLAKVSAVLGASLMLLLIYGVTGINHLNGFADFFDGLAALPKGRRAALKAMRDPSLGCGGVAATLFLLLTKWATLHQLLGEVIVFCFAEASAKLGMVFAMFTSKHWRSGVGAALAEGIDCRLATLSCSSVFVLALFLSIEWFLVLLLSLLVVPFVVLASKPLGGMSGDALGAINEVTRLTYLLLACLLS